MRMEPQGTRSLIFSGLVERGAIEQIGATGRARRAKLSACRDGHVMRRLTETVRAGGEIGVAGNRGSRRGETRSGAPGRAQ
jgi:hypothetical protein